MEGDFIEPDTTKLYRYGDIAFAQMLNKKTVPHWSIAWPRINELNRAGLLRVHPISRWMAEIEATGAAAKGVPDAR